MEAKDLAGRLILARSVKGWSQTELARACDMAPTQISRYEAGRAVPRPVVAARLARALEVSYEWLLEGSGVAGPFMLGNVPPELLKDAKIDLTISMPLEIRQQLEIAAHKADRTLTEEVLVRIKESFDRADTEIPWSLRVEEHAQEEIAQEHDRLREAVMMRLNTLRARHGVIQAAGDAAKLAKLEIAIGAAEQRLVEVEKEDEGWIDKMMEIARRISAARQPIRRRLDEAVARDLDPLVRERRRYEHETHEIEEMFGVSDADRELALRMSIARRRARYERATRGGDE